MRDCLKIVGLLACAVMLSACDVRRSVVVDAELFRQAYEAPQTHWAYFRYEGQDDRHHVLDYYDFGLDSVRMYRYSWRVPVESLPPEFPTEPQRWIGRYAEREDIARAIDIAGSGPKPKGWNRWN